MFIKMANKILVFSLSLMIGLVVTFSLEAQSETTGEIIQRYQEEAKKRIEKEKKKFEEEKKRWQALQVEAEKGDPESQRELGSEYREGRYLLQDYSKALHWLHRAAEQGDRWAMSYLGELYSEVKGVEENLVEAHMWFNLTAAKGVPSAPGKRDALAQKMTNEQIAEAQRLAREWKAKGK